MFDLKPNFEETLSITRLLGKLRWRQAAIKIRFAFQTLHEKGCNQFAWNPTVLCLLWSHITSVAEVCIFSWQHGPGSSRSHFRFLRIVTICGSQLNIWMFLVIHIQVDCNFYKPYTDCQIFHSPLNWNTFQSCFFSLWTWPYFSAKVLWTSGYFF